MIRTLPINADEQIRMWCVEQAKELVKAKKLKVQNLATNAEVLYEWVTEGGKEG